LRGIASHGRLDRRCRQFRHGPRELLTIEADDADGALVVERVALANDERTVVLAPALGTFLVGDPKTALRVVTNRRPGLEARGSRDPPTQARIGRSVLHGQTDVVIAKAIFLVGRREFFAWATGNRWVPRTKPELIPSYLTIPRCEDFVRPFPLLT